MSCGATNQGTKQRLQADCTSAARGQTPAAKKHRAQTPLRTRASPVALVRVLRGQSQPEPPKPTGARFPPRRSVAKEKQLDLLHPIGIDLTWCL